jgi:hypothetical protein
MLDGNQAQNFIIKKIDTKENACIVIKGLAMKIIALRNDFEFVLA